MQQLRGSLILLLVHYSLCSIQPWDNHLSCVPLHHLHSIALLLRCIDLAGTYYRYCRGIIGSSPLPGDRLPSVILRSTSVKPFGISGTWSPVIIFNLSLPQVTSLVFLLRFLQYSSYLHSPLIHFLEILQ